MNYTVVDTYTMQEFPANSMADIEQAVHYILDGELSEGDIEELDAFFFEVREYGSAYANGLGVEVVPHV